MAKTEITTTESKVPAFIAWNITGKDDKAFWTRIGAAWPHKDGKGLTLHLDMLPINGRIALREPAEKVEDQGGAQRAPSNLVSQS